MFNIFMLAADYSLVIFAPYLSRMAPELFITTLC
jgi:hypothetical protein